MQFVVGEQLDAAIEIPRQDLNRKKRSGAFAGADLVQGLLENKAVEMLGAKGEQGIKKQIDALLARRRFGLRPVADKAEDGDRVAHILRLHNQGEAVGKGGDRGMQR